MSMDKLKIEKVVLHEGAGLRCGKSQTDRSSFRNTDDEHVVFVGDGRWIMVWNDADDFATLVESHSIRRVTIAMGETMGETTGATLHPPPTVKAARPARETS